MKRKKEEITAVAFVLDPESNEYVNLDELPEDQKARIGEALNLRGMAAAGYRPVGAAKSKD